MSDLSIDEIIKQAEKIKAEADRQLKQAEKSLDEKTKNAIDEVVVDEARVVERIAQATRINDEDEDDDVKEYIPPKQRTSVFTKAKPLDEEDDEDDDIKIADDISPKTKILPIIEEDEIESDSDIIIIDNAKTGIVPDLNKTRKIEQKKAKAEERTRQIFVSKTKRDKRSDLESIPTIVAKEHIFEDKASTDYTEDIGVQMTFDGFDDVIETVPTIDESLAEQILEERRRNKVDKFRLFGPDETDTELGNENAIEDDYENEDEKADFINRLKSKKHAIERKITETFVLEILLVLITAFKNEAFFPTFLSSHIVYFAVALALYFAIIAINLNVIIHGFNFKKSANSDLPISITSLLILVHTIILMANNSVWIDNGILLAGVGGFALLLSQLGKRQMMIRIIDNFEFITDGADKYTIENIVNQVDAGIIARGIIDDEPLIKHSVKADFPTNFLEISCKTEPADKVSKYIFLVSSILSIILFIVIGLMDNFNTAFNVSVSAMSITVPAVSLFLTNIMLTEISQSLNKFGSRVCGIEGAKMADEANAMVMEAADLFGKDSCDLHGIKTFNGAKVDDAIIQAAAIIIQTKSPLAHVFDDVIIGKQSILPRVDDVIYEDKMGTSAWIYEKKVLVGNRDLLIRHDVSVPRESFEQKYTIKNRKALYLAIDGQIIAMFVVSYSADSRLKRELKKLEKSGISIIVKSCDPYINEQSLAKLFGLPEGYINVMNYSSARVFDKYSGMNVEKSPAYVIHNGSALGFVSAMHGAEIIVSSYHLLTFLESFGAVLGFIAIALLSLISAYAQITALSIIGFHIIWSLFMMIVAKIRGLSL